MSIIKNFFLLATTSMLLMSFTLTPITFRSVSPENLFSLNGAKAEWAQNSHDFGDIKQAVPVSVEFAFTNNGDEALTIAEVVTSCGCTASDYSTAPILPGKSSKIKVTFNANAMGAFSKTITVKSNDKEPLKLLTIKGVVI